MVYRLLDQSLHVKGPLKSKSRGCTSVREKRKDKDSNHENEACTKQVNMEHSIASTRIDRRKMSETVLEERDCKVPRDHPSSPFKCVVALPNF